jgi:hypothetical protein
VVRCRAVTLTRSPPVFSSNNEVNNVKGRLLKEGYDHYLCAGDVFFEIKNTSALKLQKELDFHLWDGWHRIICEFMPKDFSDPLRGVYPVGGMAEIVSIDLSQVKAEST